jgi:PAS domain S-box-containing protein
MPGNRLEAPEENMQANVDFKQLVEGAGDAIMVCDAQGAITLWNRAAERIFGFTEAEALGQSLDMIIPQRQRQRHWDGYQKTMETGITKYGADLLRVPALHKDGHTLSIAFTVSMLFSQSREVTGIVAIVRDETTRFAEERKLRARLQEAEATIKGDS